MSKMSSGIRQWTCASQGTSQLWTKNTTARQIRDPEEAWITGLRSRKKELRNDLSKAIIGYGHMEGPAKGTKGVTLQRQLQ